MPHKVIASNETMKAAGTVIKKLARWLVAQGYTEDVEAVQGRVREAARDLPASQKLLDALNDWLDEIAPVRSGKEIEGHSSSTGSRGNRSGWSRCSPAMR